MEIAAWCRDGYTDAQICDALGVSIPTFYKYKAIKEELLNALKVNKAVADLTVENSLFKRANGYTYKEVVKEVKTDKDGKIIFEHAKEVTKEVAPDTTAQIFWLKNRQPKKWRDKREFVQESEKATPVKVEIIAKNARLTNGPD